MSAQTETPSAPQARPRSSRVASPLRIALVDNVTDVWTASGSYTRMLAHSLRAAAGDRAEIGLLSRSETSKFDLPLWQVKPAAEPAVSRWWRSLSGRAKPSELLAAARAHSIDVLLPLFDHRGGAGSVATVGWAPDLQYRHLPHLFSEPELETRRAQTRRLARHCTRVMLSSNAVRSDFLQEAPEASDKVSVLPFPSLFAFEPPENADPHECLTRNHLPRKFALVANQFWAHKNHRVVIAAVKALKERGVEIPIAMTGLPLDPRDPGNRATSEILQAVAQAGLAGQVVVLGQVPFADLVSLMRAAAIVIQPSRSEGWSTIVQDAKALGRPALCSDIAVHREQLPAAADFFGCDDPERLASILAQQWPALRPGPDPEAEAEALRAERAFAQEHGTKLLALCQECAAEVRPR